MQYKEYSYSKYAKENKDSQEKTTRKQRSIPMTEEPGRDKRNKTSMRTEREHRQI